MEHLFFYCSYTLSSSLKFIFIFAGDEWQICILSVCVCVCVCGGGGGGGAGGLWCKRSTLVENDRSLSIEDVIHHKMPSAAFVITQPDSRTVMRL